MFVCLCHDGMVNGLPIIHFEEAGFEKTIVLCFLSNIDC